MASNADNIATSSEHCFKPIFEMHQQSSQTTTMKSQRVPKPKISADYIYSVDFRCDMTKSRRSRVKALTTKRKANDDEAVNSVDKKERRRSTKKSDAEKSKAAVPTSESSGREEREALIDAKTRPSAKANSGKELNSGSSTNNFHSSPWLINDKRSNRIHRCKVWKPACSIQTTDENQTMTSAEVAQRLQNKVKNDAEPVGSATTEVLEVITNGINYQTADSQTSKISKKSNYAVYDTSQQEGVISETRDDDDCSMFDESYSPNGDNAQFNELAMYDDNENSARTPGKSLAATMLKSKRPTLMTHIIQALSEHPDGMSGLPDVYEYIRNSSERYRTLKTEWRSSVRNCLSSSRRFIKRPRPKFSKQRGALWALNPEHPANASLLNVPKNPSKFFRSKSQTPMTNVFGNDGCARTITSYSPVDEVSLTDEDGSNASNDDAHVRSSSCAANARNLSCAPNVQPPQQIQISIISSSTSTKANSHRYSQANYDDASVQNSITSQYINATDHQQQYPIQYVYYYSSTTTKDQQQQVALQTTIGFSSEVTNMISSNSAIYTTPTTNVVATNNSQSKLTCLIDGIVTSTDSYANYTYELPAQDRQSQLYATPSGYTYYFSEEQENLPTPLVPKMESEDEYHSGNMHDLVYMQL